MGMTRPPLVSTGAVPSPRNNTKQHKFIPMKTNPATPLSDPKRCIANGGDYVTEGMAVQQQSARGALTPVL